MSEDIEKVFTDDSKSKKRTANGSFGRVRGNRRGMITAYSLMTKEQQRAYTHCDEGKSYNIYERIIPFENLRHFPVDVREKCWSSWIERFYVEDIMLAWSVDTVSDLNRILDEIDLPLLDEEEDQERGKGPAPEDAAVPVGPEEETWMTLGDLVAEDAKLTDIHIHRLMNTSELVVELNRILSGLNGTERKYSVNLSIGEVIQ
ncbi:hypothetical protein [Paenibacillus sp. Y412MC10]|uniref:hypothetical protein n=1 Tax=Geobacillus sp. (strain Y412MC10) TaxID=481743 RepID=UPI0011AB4423|nr:hypothetical protein [Paenibacillus sp. Y412MC10]